MSTDNNLSFGRIVYYEPNEIFGGNNIAVNQEDLNKYVNLSVRVPSRYYNVDSFKKYDSVLRGTQFKTKDYDDEEFIVFYLTDNYVNVSYNEIRGNGEFSAGELFGIDSIDISFDVQFFPQVTINFTDVKGFGLMSTMEYNYEEGKINNLTAKSFFTSLFNFPYPIFTLEVKGYYGKSVSFDLSLLEFNTAFDSQTGDFKTTVKFIGHMYGVYADIPMSFLMVSPYIEIDQVSNREMLGLTWNTLSNDDDIKEIPTYLSILRNFSDFILKVNYSNDGYSIYQDFIKEETKIDRLNDILTVLNEIIEISNEIKEKYRSSINCGDNDIIYVAEKYDNATEPTLGSVLVEYDNLLTLTNDGLYIAYRPIVKKTVTEDKIIWYFPDIILKRDSCFREKQLIEGSQKLEKNNLNKVLLDDITDKLHIIPNIKNIYKILFKHLHCFSEHFFNIIENINRNRNIDRLGLTYFETDIPMNNNSNKQIVPPFPAIYQTNNNERQIIYPGDVPGFENQPEVLFTEKLFKSINFFGRESIQSINQIETARNIINEVTTTESGSFFADGSNNINNLLKHYTIINVGNNLFNQNTFYDEESYKSEITRSTTIRDIFLSRLATFGRIHYTPEREDFFINTEAALLFNSWKTMNVFDEKILNNLREMKNENQYKDIILERYKTLSGGTHNGEFWGYINYQPGDENNDLDIFQLAQDGRIHYNGYSGSTIIVYAEGLSRGAGEDILNNIKFGDDFKIECDAFYKNDNLGNSRVVYSFKYNSDSYSFDGDPQYAMIENVDDIILNKTYFVTSDGFYNWGYTQSPTLGSSDTWSFLFDEYGLIYSLTDDGIINNEVMDFSERSPGYFTGSTHTGEVVNLNKIGLINKCVFHSLKEYEKAGAIYKEPFELISGAQTGTYILYDAGKLYIPTNIISNSCNTDVFRNEGISFLEYPSGFSKFIDNIPGYKERGTRSYDNEYYVIGKNFQYKREGINVLNDSKIWQIWKKFVDQVLSNYGLEANITSATHARELDKRESDKKIKTDIYYTLKTLYDKWYCGLNREYFNINNSEKGEFHKLHFLTTTFNDISNSMIVDLETFVNQISNAVLSTDQSSLSVLSFMAKTAQDNNSSFLTLPMKLNLGVTKEEVEEIFKPHNFYDGTATHDSHGVSYIIMYNGDVSHQLANNKNEYTNDGYDIANYYGNSVTPSPEAARLFAEKVDEEHDYKVPAFGVTYGMQNQNFFKNISVDTTNPSVSDYSIANTLLISERGNLAGTNNSVPSVKSIYPIYANRSYTCNVEMMGCMNITPLMYFQLNNVPLFRGAYVITNVHHRITPNDFTTTFSGVRVSKYKIPINKDAIGITSLLRTIGLSDGDRTNGAFSYETSNDADLQIVLNREVFYPTGTVGRLYINGEFACFTMEPPHSGVSSCNTPGSGSLICPNTYNITYGLSYYGELWGRKDKHKIYKAAGTYSAKTENGIESYCICTPRLNSNESSFNNRGILIHMGNSNRNGWSRGCIIVGYPSNQYSSMDLTNSGDTTLKNLTTFASGNGNNSYEGNLAEPEKWGSFRAYKYVANIIKEAVAAGKTVKLTVNQCDNIPDPVTQKTVCLMDPPSYSNNTASNIPNACKEIYNSLTAVTNWATDMSSKNMVKIQSHDNLSIDLKYATPNNFARTTMYVGLDKSVDAYIHKNYSGIVPTMCYILGAQSDDQAKKTKLVIYDAARPSKVSEFMKCLETHSPYKSSFPAIAGPRVSRHNYGAALDISLIGPDNKPLFMGANFDQASGGTGTKGDLATHMDKSNSINGLVPTSITFKYAEISDGFKYSCDNGGGDIEYSKYYVTGITAGGASVSNFLTNYTSSAMIERVKNGLRNGNLLNEIDNETQNKIAKGILNNRALLILLARKAGMQSISSEWWHYQLDKSNIQPV